MTAMKIEIGLQPIGAALTRVADMHWRDEVRECPIHGSYVARLVFIDQGHYQKQVAFGSCPKCEQLKKEAAAKAEAEARAREEAARVQKEIAEALGRASIPQEFSDKSFETFQADTPELKLAFELSKRFVKNWQKAKEGGYGLFFFGNPGTGKSHLAISILKELIPQGVTGLYTRVPDLISYIRAHWRADADISSYDAVRHFVDMGLLVLDELGVQAGTPNEQALLFEVIDARLSENKPTIFLSNFAPQDLADVIGVRLVDRIKGKCVPQRFSGKSRRKPLTADVFGEAA